MLSNLPPGVTDNMLPGSRPEDEEIEFTLVLTLRDLEEIGEYLDREKNSALKETLSSILNQCEPYQQRCELWEEMKGAYERNEQLIGEVQKA